MKQIYSVILLGLMLSLPATLWGQEVGTSECGEAQELAQLTVSLSGPYRNHGQRVRTAAQSINPALASGYITYECHSCIVSQFARRIPVSEQENCGFVRCPCWTDEELTGFTPTECVQSPDDEFLQVATAEMITFTTSDSEFPECNVVDHVQQIGFALAITHDEFLACRSGLMALKDAAALTCSEP